MNKHLKRSAIIASCLLLLFVAALCDLTWRQMQQQRLDHDLLAGIKRNDVKAVLSTLKAGADPNARDNDNEKESHGTFLTFWQLLQDRFTGHPRADGNSALYLTMIPFDGRPNDEFNDIPDAKIRRALLDAGANPNVATEFGSTPLMMATSFTDTATVQLLLDHHADVNAQDSMKHTALIDAAANSNASIAHVLLEHGAKIEARTEEGYTPLFVAAIDGNEDTLRLLLRYHANINSVSDEGMSILDAAKKSRNSNVVHLLEKAGARP